MNQIQPQTRRGLVWHPQQSADYRGNHNFHQDREGVVVRTSSGQPQCNYCLIPSHSRENCILRREHLSQGIDLLYHPQKGMLRSRNSRRILAISKKQEYERKFRADGTVNNSIQEFSQSPNEIQVKRKDRDQEDRGFDVPHLESGQEHSQDTKPKKREYPNSTLASSRDTGGYKKILANAVGTPHLLRHRTYPMQLLQHTIAWAQGLLLQKGWRGHQHISGTPPRPGEFIIAKPTAPKYATP